MLRSRWVLWSRMTVAMGTALGVMLALAGTASAMAPPHVTSLPVVSGTAQVGQEVTSVGATWTGDEPLEVTWTWLRCSGPDVSDCRAISGASGLTYRVTSADLGRRLRVLLVLSNRRGRAWAVSPASASVTNPPPPAPPPPPPPPPPPVPPPPPPVPAPLIQPVASPTPVPVAVPVPAPVVKAPKMMRPFPVIRIRGSLTRTGAKVTLLTVKAPAGAGILVRCIGRSCPVNKWAHAASITHILPLQRRLAAGTKLVITVTRANRIGKHTTFVIRKGKPPKRVDRCIWPGAKKPTKCVPT